MSFRKNNLTLPNPAVSNFKIQKLYVGLNFLSIDWYDRIGLTILCYKNTKFYRMTIIHRSLIRKLFDLSSLISYVFWNPNPLSFKPRVDCRLLAETINYITVGLLLHQFWLGSEKKFTRSRFLNVYAEGKVSRFTHYDANQ